MHSWCQQDLSAKQEKFSSSFFAEIRKITVLGCIAVRKDKSLSEMEVLQMQNAMRVDAMPQEDEIPDEELIDTLIAISSPFAHSALLLRIAVCLPGSYGHSAYTQNRYFQCGR